MFALPKLEKATDAVKASAAIVEAVAAGDLTPAEASELSRLVEGFTQAVEPFAILPHTLTTEEWQAKNESQDNQG